MKNVVILTIDSFTVEGLKDERYGTCAMPFFKSLMEKSVWAGNYYSQGPHTELGLQAMLTGMNTLDDSATLRRTVYARKTIFDYYKEAGYKLAHITWPSNYYPRRLYDVIENYYTQGDSFEKVALYKLMCYTEIYQKGEMQEQDYIDLIGCFTDSFNSYLHFLNTEEHSALSYRLVKDRLHGIDLKKRYTDVKKEYDLFSRDKRAYVVRLLKNGGTLPDALQVRDNNSAYEEEQIRKKIEKIVSRHKVFLRKLIRRQLRDFVFDPRTSVIRMGKSFLDDLRGKKPQYYFRALYSGVKFSKRLHPLRMNRHKIDSCSLKTQLEFLSDLLDHNSGSEQPYFVYMHTGSQHHPTQWLSMDRDAEEIEKELEAAAELIRETKHYHGMYAYWLGMRYLDECIHLFVDRLKERGILENTLLVITADHGSSCCMGPLRDELVFNNCHTELYHIPFLAYHPHIAPRKLSGYYTHRDFIPTVLELSEISAPPVGRGHSMLDPACHPAFAMAERTEGGTPALLHKKAIYTIRDDRYLLEYQCGVFEDFDQGWLKNAYDLRRDPDETRNLAKTIDRADIAYLLKEIRNRHEELGENYREWLKKDVSNLE